MKAQFLKMGGVKSEAEFYKKFPTEEAFFQAYPQAQMMKKGGTFSGNTYYQSGGEIDFITWAEQNGYNLSKDNEGLLYRLYEQAIANNSQFDPGQSQQSVQLPQLTAEQQSDFDAFETNYTIPQNVTAAPVFKGDPSIVNLLKNQGKAYSYKDRAKLAEQLGINNYRGTADQNLQLISRLQNNESLMNSLPTKSGKAKNTTQQSNPAVQSPVVPIPANATSYGYPYSNLQSLIVPNSPDNVGSSKGKKGSTEDKLLQDEGKRAHATRVAATENLKEVPFKFPDGTIKVYKDMTLAEKAYVSGKNLGYMGNNLFESDNDPVGYFADMVDNLGTGFYNSQKTNSVKPMVKGIGTPLLTGMGAGLLLPRTQTLPYNPNQLPSGTRQIGTGTRMLGPGATRIAGPNTGVSVVGNTLPSVNSYNAFNNSSGLPLQNMINTFVSQPANEKKPAKKNSNNKRKYGGGYYMAEEGMEVPTPARWHSEWDQENEMQEQLGVDPLMRVGNTTTPPIKSVKKKRDGLKDYMMVNAGLDAATGLANQFSSRDREMNNFMQRQQMADNLFPVKSGDFSGSQGNYAVTGSGYGQFRPDQMGAKSPDGMYNGMFYPQMRDGGNFADQFQVSVDDITNSNIDYALLNSSVQPFNNSPESAEYEPAPVNTNVKVNNTAKSAYDYYVNERNLQPHIAAGIIGNLYQESKLKTTAVEKGNTGNGRGIAQWDVRDRWKGLLNWAAMSGRDPYALQTQLDYVLEEPGEGKKALKKLKATTTPEEATMVFGRTYERPSEKHANWNYRTSVASKLYNQQFKNGGEYELTADEIMAIRANGGEIEFL